MQNYELPPGSLPYTNSFGAPVTAPEGPFVFSAPGAGSQQPGQTNLAAFSPTSFAASLPNEAFEWPHDMVFDATTGFVFQPGLTVPGPPASGAPMLPQQQASAPPPAFAAPGPPQQPGATRFHPYPSTQSPATRWQTTTGANSPASSSAPSPNDVRTPRPPASVASATSPMQQKQSVTYPVSSPPIQLIPAPSPFAKASPTAPAPARPRPTLRRSKSTPTLEAAAANASTSDKLDSLFTFLDEQKWSLADMLLAISETSRDEEGSDTRSEEHVRRLEAFLRKEKGVGRKEDVCGPDEIEKMWRSMDPGREAGGEEDSLMSAVNDLGRRTEEGHGSIIRKILTRDGVPYEESNTDIQLLDQTLSRPPSPRSFAQPRAPAPSASTTDASFTGRVVIPSTQADILGFWLMSPGRPAVHDEKDSITPDHMRIYSSLSPLDLHARGAELCRVILTRDRQLKAQYGNFINDLERLVQGPIIAPSRRCEFDTYDDYALWHHGLMTYLQLCTRYPSFRDSKDASIEIAKDLLTLPPSLLESALIERALYTHWESFRLYLVEEGGLLRSAVRAFSGAKVRPMDLMLICDDAAVVLKALRKSLKDTNERILAYDPAISEARNNWRQSAYWAANSHFVGWSAATTHFLEISALYPKFSEGVRDLPGLSTLLNRSSDRMVE